MNLDQVFDAFSNRSKNRNNQPDSLTQEFKNRFIMRCVDLFYTEQSLLGQNEFWIVMDAKLRQLYGKISLSDEYYLPPWKQVLSFLDNCSDPQYLDFVEFTFRIQHQLNISLRGRMTVMEVNRLFDEDSIPFFLTDYVYSEYQVDWGMAKRLSRFPRIIRRDSTILHENSIEPTLALLTQPELTHANEEFIDALDDYRKGEYKDCV